MNRSNPQTLFPCLDMGIPFKRFGARGKPGAFSGCLYIAVCENSGGIFISWGCFILEFLSFLALTYELFIFFWKTGSVEASQVILTSIVQKGALDSVLGSPRMTYIPKPPIQTISWTYDKGSLFTMVPPRSIVKHQHQPMNQPEMT